MPIHPTAIVDPAAEVSPEADIGAYAVIERDVTIASQVRIWPHAYVAAGTTLEPGAQVHPFAVVGHWPQDYAWKGAPSYTHVGAGTIIREHASIHRGTIPESTTRVGERVFVMAMAHVGHNCQVADDAMIISGALLAGHVQIGRKAMIGGGATVHQFCRVGELAAVGGNIRVTQDLPPFMLADESGVVGLNTVGLRRDGITGPDRLELRRCFSTLYRGPRGFRAAIAEIVESARGEPARRLAAFLAQPSRRGYLGRRKRAGRAIDEAPPDAPPDLAS